MQRSRLRFRPSVMTEPNKYLALERLRDGRQIEIRALKPTHEEDMLAAIDRTRTRSLHRRFFAAKKHFSEGEKAFFLKVDFVNHVALVAVAEDGGSDASSSAADVTSSCGREQPRSHSR